MGRIRGNTGSPLAGGRDGLLAHTALAVKKYVAGLDGTLIVHDLGPAMPRSSTPMSGAGATPSAPASHPRPLQKDERLADRITAQLAELARRPALVPSFSPIPV